MKKNLLHTPEGVRDIYNSECEVKLNLQRSLNDLLLSYGYHNIQTPSFEFFDIFNHERGTISSKDMYKFFDRDGSTLVLRPDITPSIARCVAKYYKEETMPIRLSYLGNTFRNSTSYQGKLKEVTHLGAELFNHGGADADGEMIAMTIECLLKSGLKEFQLEIGDADFLPSLVEEAGFKEEDAAELKTLIENKNMFGIEEMIMSKELNPDLKKMFLEFLELFGSLDMLEYAKSITKNPRALKIIGRLERLNDILNDYGFSKYVSFDLGMVSELDYYTGVIFKVYTYGTGEPIATGGRYDNLVSQFGKEAPAIGLSIVIDQLMLALSRQKLLEKANSQGTLILYKEKYRKKAIDLANKFRRDGLDITLQLYIDKYKLDDYISYSKRMAIGGILYLDNDKTIKIVDASTGDVKETDYGLSL